MAKQELQEKQHRILEFYSGIGGMHYAFDLSGYQGQVLKAFDINTTANEVYAHNHGKKQLAQRNIEAVPKEFYDKQQADVWLMSPPCQPYTRTGNQEGSKDTRAKSFLYLMSILPELEHQPSYLLLENVKGFEESDSRDLLVETLTKCGYEYQELLITPLQIGIPNSRMRYYCLARKTDKVGPFQRPVTGTLIGYIPSSAKDSIDQDGFVDTRRQGELSGLSTSASARAAAAAETTTTTAITASTAEKHPASPAPDTEEGAEKNNTTKKRRTSVETKINVSTADRQELHKPNEDDILQDPVRASQIDPLADYIEFLDKDDERMARYTISDNTLLKYGRLFDIVKPSTRRSCCFTKGYHHFVESTGSILQMVEDMDTAAVYEEAMALKGTEEGDAKALTLLRSLQLRYFTEGEIARLMGFPIQDGRFSFPEKTTLKQRYRVLGNSINVKVVSELIRYLLA
ncbi:tRNA (cytosine-5-)-methyltransferase [Actinomortierella ambigua]|uniref:tRNA (cytosine(38)-C(5))-methyltransferase n=1 Tax=Actinomortierella ambigua TaxID=1343610 RepID=A0A9P6UBR8_9FUNG|nr:tRNA (cytosine-5-)-methyltransferase [Actinomortierella ambigua]